MKKLIFIVILVLLATVSNAPGSSLHRIGSFLGDEGKPAGCFCCVKATCVVAKNEADCKKIGGVKVKKCKECGEAAEKKE